MENNKTLSDKEKVEIKYCLKAISTETSNCDKLLGDATDEVSLKKKRSHIAIRNHCRTILGFVCDSKEMGKPEQFL